MDNPKRSKELEAKVAESITVRGIAASIQSMVLPGFKSLDELLQLEGYKLIKMQTNNNNLKNEQDGKTNAESGGETDI